MTSTADHPERVALPLPLYAVGTQVDPRGAMTPYCRKLILRWQIRNTLEVLGRLRHKGFGPRDGGPVLSDHCKGLIRAAMRVVDSAHDGEIAGVQPRTMHCLGNGAHQSYLRNGQSHSGVHYRYNLLFRATVDGQEKVLIHPEGIFSDLDIECGLAAHTLPDAPDLTDAEAAPNTEGIDPWNHTGWLLQLAPETEFVAWDYGKPERYDLQHPIHRMNRVHRDLVTSYFDLPAPFRGRKPAIELERRVCCGWRFLHGGTPITEWLLAGTRREAIEDARRFAAKESERDPFRRRGLLDALDQRQITIRKPAPSLD